MLRRKRPGASAGGDGAGRESEVADDLAVFARDEGARRAADLIRRRTAFEPAVQRRYPAVEAGDVVVGGKRFRSAQHPVQAVFQGALLRIVRCRRSLGWAGRSSRFRNSP